jgi:hypothetical protein
MYIIKEIAKNIPLKHQFLLRNKLSFIYFPVGMDEDNNLYYDNSN